MISKLLIIGCVIAGLSSTALAAHPLITDDTGTQGQGKYQLEINGEVTRDKTVEEGVKIRERGAEMAASFSAGVTDTIDMVIGAPWTWNRLKGDGIVVSDENGIGDVSVEMKWRFFQHDGFGLAVKPGLALPTGNEKRGLGNGRTSYSMTMIASQEIQPFTFHVNVSYTNNRFALTADRDSNRRAIWHGSVAGTYEVVKGLQLVGNVGAESNSNRHSRTWPAFIIGGAIYSVTENFDLDLGIKGGLNNPETDIAYMAGLAYRF